MLGNDCTRVISRVVIPLLEFSRNQRNVSAFATRSLSDAQQKLEEYATSIEKFLALIETLNDHKAELTGRVETLAAEERATQEEMAACTARIEQLRETIDKQELSQEDVRRMEREKARIEEQVAKQDSIREGHAAALKEAEEKRRALHEALERSVEGYNAAARRVGLAPVGARHAGGEDFVVALDECRAAEGVAEMMGGVDVAGVVGPRANELAERYEKETAEAKERVSEARRKTVSAERSSERLAGDIEVSPSSGMSVELLVYP